MVISAGRPTPIAVRFRGRPGSTTAPARGVAARAGAALGRIARRLHDDPAAEWIAKLEHGAR